LTPVASPVHDQQAEIADRFADYTEESSDEEYVDETAELYDPEADEALAVAAAEVEEQEEEALVLDAPLLSVKPSRVIVPANETEAAQVPVAATPVAAPAPVAPAPVAAVRNPAPRQPRQRAAAGSKAKAAFTLRLDAARHLKLRLACAVSGRSAQQLVTEALDQLLDAMPDVQAMADRAPDKRASR
jgi:hypothetical protein